MSEWNHIPSSAISIIFLLILLSLPTFLSSHFSCCSLSLPSTTHFHSIILIPFIQPTNNSEDQLYFKALNLMLRKTKVDTDSSWGPYNLHVCVLYQSSWTSQIPRTMICYQFPQTVLIPNNWACQPLPQQHTHNCQLLGAFGGVSIQYDCTLKCRAPVITGSIRTRPWQGHWRDMFHVTMCPALCGPSKFS